MSISRPRLVSFVVALSLSVTLIFGSAPAVRADDSAAAAEIDQFLTDLTVKDLFSGSVLIARGDEVIFSKGYGYANRDLSVENTPETVFQIASITKQFVAVGILKLQEMGKLTVQDPICEYLDNCPAAWQAITIHHLLTHTSGIVSYTELPNFNATKQLPSPPVRTMDRFRDLPLQFEPGTKFYYSNSGYIVLSVIIRKAYGKPLNTFLRQELFVPLGLESTQIGDNSRVIKNRATGYASAKEVAAYFDLSLADAAGGLLSTVNDLHRWTRALWGGKIVSQATLDAMLQVRIPVPPPPPNLTYSYGLYALPLRIGHGGFNDGFVSELDYYPEDQITVVVLSNIESAQPFVISEIMWSKVTGKEKSTS